MQEAEMPMKERLRYIKISLSEGHNFTIISKTSDSYYVIDNKTGQRVVLKIQDYNPSFDIGVTIEVFTARMKYHFGGSVPIVRMQVHEPFTEAEYELDDKFIGLTMPEINELVVENEMFRDEAPNNLAEYHKNKNLLDQLRLHMNIKNLWLSADLYYRWE